jgi:hypothetical protein
MNRWRVFLGVILIVPTGSVLAQRITIQQPVIENFSVATTVSVPDRGSALLGSVSSAASGRTVAGPFRSGSSFGLSRQFSSASVHVYIHDFEAMDAALLAVPRSISTSKLDPRIARRLHQRAAPSEKSERTAVGDEQVARQAEWLAEQAEGRGKFGVARLHWQRAARHGSVRATTRLAEMHAANASK